MPLYMKKMSSQPLDTVVSSNPIWEGKKSNIPQRFVFTRRGFADRVNMKQKALCFTRFCAQCRAAHKIHAFPHGL